MKNYRSFLFVPGDRPERFEKACAAGADAVILDLEDAVATQNKLNARNLAAQWLSSPPPVPVIVRVNGVESDWLDEDLVALTSACAAGIMLPKTSSPADIDYVTTRLGPRLPLIALIETAQGLMRAYEIARHEQVMRLAFGSIDFQLETGIQGERDALLFARSQLVIHSRAAGVQAPIDGVCTSTDDPNRVLEDSRYARSLGFTGKLCIHPSQVAAVHEGFAPSPEELTWARALMELVDARGNGGAIRFEGKMVDLPVIERARQILEHS